MLMEAPSQEAQATALSSNVLDRFNELREEVIETLSAAHKLAQTVGPLAEQVEPHIAAAHRQVRESRLNLVIVGSEGVGKSTLINAIAGTELSPQEQMYPGTVAPVFLDWSSDTEHVFTVLQRGESEPVRCRDADEFRSYLLQKDNQDNHKQVVWGRVTVDHPILAKGLRLVDMPGVEGLSPVIAIEAQRFIQSFAHAVAMLGSIVVKGCAAVSARAPPPSGHNALNKVDLPAEGLPTNPTTNFHTRCAEQEPSRGDTFLTNGFFDKWRRISVATV